MLEGSQRLFHGNCNIRLGGKCFPAPMIAHKVPKTLLCPIGVSMVIKIFQVETDCFISMTASFSSFIFLSLIRSSCQLSMYRAACRDPFLCVTANSIVKGTLKPCHTGQQPSIQSGICVLLYCLCRGRQVMVALLCFVTPFRSDFQSVNGCHLSLFHPIFQNPLLLVSGSNFHIFEFWLNLF